MTNVILSTGLLYADELDAYEKWMRENNMHGEYRSTRTGYDAYTSEMQFYEAEDAMYFKLRFGL